LTPSSDPRYTRPMQKLILALPFALMICDIEPVFAESDPAPTAAEIVGVMAKLPSEACLFHPKGVGCDHPGGYDKGPDARRIAEAIATTANGAIMGSRKLDAAVMATFSSYESGNNASAVGDHGKAHGAWQMWFASEDIAFDPAQAALVWRSLAVSSMNTGACKTLPPDEKLAGLAGSCVYYPARVKVRQRVQAARAALESMVDVPDVR
jgi:hypothetical protein